MPEYWSLVIDITLHAPGRERRYGLFTLGFSWRGIFRRPEITRFEHGFDALFGGLWIGLEKPHAAAHP